MNCGRCIACRRGKTNCCVNMRVLGVHIDGGMRELLVVPVRKLHPAASLTVDQLALVEPLGIGAHAVQRAQLEAGETALVVGTGPIGMGAIQFAQAAGARVIALDVNEKRLQFCRERLKVEHIICEPLPAAPQGEPAGPPAPHPETLKRLAELTGGDMPTAVFDATGNAESMMKAFGYVASGGRIVFIGVVQADITFSDPDFNKREVTLFATRNAAGDDFRRIIALMEAGRIDTTPWITHRARYDELSARFAGWFEPQAGTLKAVVEF
jgi:2-desacetyl-2-hydroxyethyl bacteriochlorophyllide A dehydrogenase